MTLTLPEGAAAREADRGLPGSQRPYQADRPLLELRSISKRFGVVQALDGVDFEVRAGEVHALVGENGAGKSTLLKILFGVVEPDEGQVLLEGAPDRLGSPRAALDAGVAMIAQELSLVPEFTVAQNVLLGHEPGRGGRIDWRGLGREAAQALMDLGVEGLELDRPVRTLSVAARQLVEIARAVHRAARLVVMDEPTSSLPQHETEIILDAVRRLRDQGIAVVYVSHRLDEVRAVADRVTVLRDGRVAAQLARADTSEDEIVRHMVGRDVFPGSDRPPVPADAPVVLRARGIHRRGVVEPTDLEVRAGEIVGIAGLVGAGRTELVRLLFGADRPDGGEVWVGDQRLPPGSPRAAIAAGLGFVTEDRKQQGLILHASVTSNVTLPVLRRFQRAGVLLDHARRDALAEQLGRRVALRPLGGRIRVQNLSGGNQQKVVIAKWLATECRVVIFDEPTRGIDIGGKAEVHKLMAELASEGVGVVMVSSELPEILRLSDRVLVMRRGRVVLEAQRDQVSEETIGRALVGAGNGD